MHDGHLVRGLPAPNHMLPVDALAEADQRRRGVSPKYRWPLTSAMRNATDDEAEAGLKTVGVFVSPIHGADHWSEWADRPPCWMDPHWLISLAAQYPEMQQVLAAGFKKNDIRTYKRVQDLLQKVFEETYLPWMIEQFTEHAAELIAKWAVNDYVDQRLRSSKRKKP